MEIRGQRFGQHDSRELKHDHQCRFLNQRTAAADHSGLRIKLDDLVSTRLRLITISMLYFSAHIFRRNIQEAMLTSRLGACTFA